MVTIFSLENLKGKDHVENLGIDGRIILKRILENRVGRCELDACV
jgi:hypothetical protein